MFHLIIRGRNCAKYINRCLDSCLAQTDENWKASIVLDPCKDKTPHKLARYFKEYPGKFNITMHHEPMGLSYNYRYAIGAANPKPEDILGMLDADDYLAKHAVEIVKKHYAKTGCLLTYGSFAFASNRKKSRICKPYPKGVKVRKHTWAATHFKTMKFKLYDQIPMDYFTHKGKWIPAASDVALMIPAMELAGLKRCRHIKKVLYYYTENNPSKVKRGKQRKWARIVKGKKALKKVF